MSVEDVIVIVDDDKLFCQLVEKTLIRKKFNCISMSTYSEALGWIKREKATHNIKLFILDLNIENEFDGLDLCREIRTATQIPVLMLTANDSTETVIKCLEAGANQYVIKPFKSEELIARINAAIGNSKNSSRGISSKDLGFVIVGEFKIDTKLRKLAYKNKSIDLTENEIMLISLLLQNHEENVSRERISIMIHGAERNVMSRNIDMAIARLRRKLTKNEFPLVINHIRGYGYKLSIIGNNEV